MTWDNAMEVKDDIEDLNNLVKHLENKIMTLYDIVDTLIVYKKGSNEWQQAINLFNRL